MRRSDTGAVIVDKPSEEYEKACLDAVRTTLLESPTIKRDGTEVESIEIVVDGDQRSLVVSLVYKGHPKQLTWRLYEDVFSGDLPPGQAEEPDGVATQIYISAIGG